MPCMNSNLINFIQGHKELNAILYYQTEWTEALFTINTVKGEQVIQNNVNSAVI